MFGVKTGSEAIYVLGHFTFFLKTALVKEGHRGTGVLMLQMSTLLCMNHVACQLQNIHVGFSDELS